MRLSVKQRHVGSLITGLVLGCVALLRAAEPAPVEGPIADLAAKIERGEAKLEYQPGPLGYLPSLLKNLGINQDSQLLVFSKTSFQSAKISPKAPRAIFFNDNVAIGSVQGGEVLEVISLTPKNGIVYYTLNAKPTDRPRFEERGGACNSCHVPQNHGVAGWMATSVFPDPDGLPLFVGKFFPPIDHRTPMEERWGGWYVTGTHGSQRHRGNAIVPDSRRPADFETEGTQNLTDLSGKVDLSNYLARSSDIVALMTLEHQTAMTNYLVRLSPAPRNGSRDVAGETLDALTDEVAAYMLFSPEMPIREPIQGNTTFTKTFAERGPRDSKGRSLRDFDLQKRMFKYPLSYMIYSDAFENLPQPARDKIYRRIYDVLTAKTPSPKFAHLSAADRQAILEIVRETKSNLPKYWK